jgi:Trk K+ transport system NAD-binding subunit
VLIAEAAAMGTPLVGKTLGELRLRPAIGVAVAGIWNRGEFLAARADSKIEAHCVLVFAGSKDALARYDASFGRFSRKEAPVLILGAGRVGRATAQALAAAGFDYRIVERDARAAGNDRRIIVGDAADLAVLNAAGLEDAQTIVVTTRRDDVNAYLTIYCRKLRPEAQILARCTGERSLATLHRAGADLVMSYASMGSNVILNHLKQERMLMVAEGLDVFRMRVPAALAGKTVGGCGIREKTGCSIVALGAAGQMRIVPGPDETLAADSDLLLIGTLEAQGVFHELFPEPRANTNAGR